MISVRKILQTHLPYQSPMKERHSTFMTRFLNKKRETQRTPHGIVPRTALGETLRTHHVTSKRVEEKDKIHADHTRRRTDRSQHETRQHMSPMSTTQTQRDSELTRLLRQNPVIHQ